MLSDDADKARTSSKFSVFIDTFQSTKTYFSYDEGLAGLALAMLYMNIMSYGSVMTAYVASRKLSTGLIGFTRGISAVIGLLGTIVFQHFSKTHALAVVGMCSILMQAGFLGISYSSEWVTNNSYSLAMLIGGVCVSRVGLWSFDLSVSQIMQEKVFEKDRGAVGGTQTALCSLFEMISFLTGIIWSSPDQFHILISISYAGILLSAVLFLVFYKKERQTSR